MDLSRRGVAWAVIAAIVAACAPGLPARAQSGNWVEPPAKVPRAQLGDRTHNIDVLFDALKIAPDDDSAKAIENRIWALWMASGSDTTDLLMNRARQAADQKEYDLALRLLNGIIEIRPSYTEAWNRRATIYFLKKDFRNSLADIEQVLVREPRHFGALAGLGTILEEFGDEKHALEAYRKALAVYPRLQGIGEHVKTLTEKVEGRDI